MPIVIIDTDELSRLINDAVAQAVENFSQQFLPTTPRIEDTLLQINEVAKILNVSLSTVHTYKKNGHLTFHRIGRRIYFRQSEVLDALKKVN